MTANSEASHQEAIDALDPRKLRLECRKLEAEIAELSRPWWRRPGQWAAILGGLATLLAVLWGFVSGFLPAPRLEQDIAALETEFEVKFSVRDIMSMASVDDIQQVLDAKSAR